MCLHVEVSTGDRVCKFVDLVSEVLGRAGPVRLVAVDGPGGAGKSTFSRRFAAAAGDRVYQVHTDDFASWEEPFEWWPRLLAQVIEPLLAGKRGRFQRYDWETRQPEEWNEVPLMPIVLIEGVGSSRRDWRDHLAMAIWVETPRSLRLGRGLARDGEDTVHLWRKWTEAEDSHFAVDEPLARIDLIVDGDPSASHDPEAEFVLCPSSPELGSV